MPTNMQIYILFFTNILLMFVGISVGLSFGLLFLRRNKTEDSKSINDIVSVKSKKDNRNQSVIEIDDTKYVSKIQTSNLEKKYEKLGETKRADNDTTSSVNKLKNLKG